MATKTTGTYQNAFSKQEDVILAARALLEQVEVATTGEGLGSAIDDLKRAIEEYDALEEE